MSQYNPYQNPQFGGGYPAQHRPGQPLASLLRRLGAQLLDGLILTIAYAPGLVMFYAGDSSRSKEMAVAGVGLLFVGVLAILIVQIILLSTQGQTIGKKIVGVRIVDYTTGEIAGFVKAFLLRALVNGLIVGIPCLGAIYALVDVLFIFGDERRCLHDLIAGTKVVEA